jgi:RND family efflux transporter MFP subunit
MRYFLSLLLLLSSALSWAHGDDDHAHDAPTAVVTVGLPRIELTSDALEVVAVLTEQRLQLYVDQWDSNEPVDNATITVQWNNTTLDAVRIDNGVYRTSPVPVNDHVISLIITVQYNDTADLLNAQWTLPSISSDDQHWHVPSWLYMVISVIVALVVGWWLGKRRVAMLPLIVLAIVLTPRVDAHGDDTHGAEEPVQSKLLNAAEKATRLSDGSLFVPKPVQRLLGIRTQLADFSNTAFNAKLPAEVTIDPKRGGAVQAPVNGRVMAYKNRWPTPGQAVKKGQVLLQLQWQLSATEHAQTQAQLARVDAQLRVADARWKRIQHLTETLSQKELEQARADVESLRAERDALHNSINAPQLLRAPTDGVISRIEVNEGQHVSANDHLINIIGGELTVTALAPSDFIPVKNPIAAFVSGQRRVPLQLIGETRELKDQQRPLLFEMREGSAQFAIGDSGQVLIETELQQNGVKVPAQAIVRAEDGSKAVIVKRSAETYRLQTVHVQNLSGGEVLLLSGIRAGERVVTEGAPLLAQLR